jgi:hypothetical protein
MKTLRASRWTLAEPRSPVMELTVIGRPRAAKVIGGEPETGPAAACLERLHDAHIGATPRIARDLVRFREGAGLWLPAATRLSTTQSSGNTSLHYERHIWRHAPLFALLTCLAVPVVRAACTAQGQSIVIGDRSLSRDGERIGRNNYAQYADRLEETVHTLLATEEAMGRPFWQAAGHHIMNALMRGTGFEALAGEGGGAIATGDLDEALLSFLIEADPDFSGISRRQFSKRMKGTRATHDRTGIKPKEGGVVGVRASRSIEDIPDMLNSEFLTPGILLTEKLITGPFLVRHRPPARRPKRHVLLIGACADPVDQDGMRLAKAAWLQAAFRLSEWLSDQGMENSEIRWIERVPGDGLQVLRANMAGHALGENDLHRPSTADMLRFYKSLRWFPGLGDRRAGCGLQSQGVEKQSEDPASNLMGDQQLRWLRAAFDRSWKTMAAGGELAVEAKEFLHVHIQVLRADPSRHGADMAQEWPVQREKIVQELRLPHAVRATVDLLAVSRTFGAMRLWRHKSKEPELFKEIAHDETGALLRDYAQIIDSLCHGCLTATVEKAHGS